MCVCVCVTRHGNEGAHTTHQKYKNLSTSPPQHHKHKKQNWQVSFPVEWRVPLHCTHRRTGKPMVVHPMQVKHNGCRSPFIRPFYPCPIPPQCICVRAIMIVFCVLRGSNFDAVYALPVVPSGPQRCISTPSTGSSSRDDGTCYTKPGVHKKACTHSSRTMGSGTALPAMWGGGCTGRRARWIERMFLKRLFSCCIPLSLSLSLCLAQFCSPVCRSKLSLSAISSVGF